MLDSLDIICEEVGCQQADFKFDSQKVQPCNSASSKANTDWGIKADNADPVDANLNTSNYFRSSINRAAYKRVCQAIMPKYTRNSVVFFSNSVF